MNRLQTLRMLDYDYEQFVLNGGSAPAKSGHVIACAGNSITFGFASRIPWPAMLQAQLTAGGLAGATVSNLGHGGYTIAALAALISTDVDPLYDATKHTTLIFQEGTNSLGGSGPPPNGLTGAQVYAATQSYLQATAHRWDYVVVIAATKSQPAGYWIAGVNASGSAPPAVTASAVCAVGTIVTIVVTTDGARGTALFDWYKNGVLQASAVATAATVVLDGITYTMPTGTYTNNNRYANTAGKEAERQAYLALIASDPTFGGYADVTYVPDATDARFQNVANGFFYNTSDQTHWLEALDGVCASALLTLLRGKYGIADSVAHAPMPNPYLSSRSGLKNTSNAAPANGDSIKSWTPVLSMDSYSGSTMSGSGDFATASSYPIYVASGIGGKPALSVSGAQPLLSTNNIRSRCLYTMIAVLSSTVGGVGNAIVLNGSAGTPVDLRFFATDGSGSYCLYDYDPSSFGGSLKGAPAGTMVGAGRTFLVATCDGTHAGHKLYVSNAATGNVLTLVSTVTFSTYSQDPTTVDYVDQTIALMSSLSGQMTDFYFTALPMSAAEIAHVFALIG